METIIKYKAKNGEEFNDPVDCLNYEKTLVDKNGKEYQEGDWIKESWCFHGFGSGSILPNTVRVNDMEFKNLDKLFRLFQYHPNLRLSVDRVNRLGWPVSDYEAEIISEEEVNKLKGDPKYYLQKYSQDSGWGHYRLR